MSTTASDERHEGDEALGQREVHRGEAEQHEQRHGKGALGLLAGEDDLVLQVGVGHAPILAHGADRPRSTPTDTLRGVTSEAPASAPARRAPVDVVVLVSGSGTLLQALIDASADPAYGVRIAAVGADRPCLGLERAERAGIPTFTVRTDRAFPTGRAWDVALAERVAAASPRFVVTAGFMRILGPATLGVRPGRQHPPGPAAELPRRPRGARRPRLRRQGDRHDVPRRRRRRRHRADHRAARRRRRGRRHRGEPARAHQGPGARAARRRRAAAWPARASPSRADEFGSVPSRARRGLLSRSTVGWRTRLARVGHHRGVTSGASTAWVPRENGSRRVRPTRGTPRPMSPNQECTHDRRHRAGDGRRPIRRALVSVYDKTGLEELARALDAAGVAIVSTGLDREDHRRRGHPGDAGRGADRLPRVPRRPGQDAAPQGARRHPRRHPQPRPRAAARRPRRRAVRPRRRQPLPVPRDRRLGRDARTSASSRSTSAARRWCAPPPRTTRASRS